MRKYIGLVFLFVGFSAFGQIQDYKIGIKIGPSFSNVRTSVEGSNTSLNRDGTAVKFLLGAFVDIPFKENYYFHTGINFASKATKIRASSNTVPGPLNEEYDHEYLQVPMLLKLYTNEIFLDTRLFFNFGLVPELRLNTSNEDPANLLVTKFKTFDLAGNFGGGVERGIGVNTRVFASLNYNIGFLNQISVQNPAWNTFDLKSNLISLEFGVKF